MTRVVVMMGAPGAGKGTQALRLSQELGLPHIATGDLFRENLSKGTPLGEKARGYMNAGQLVPDALVIDMLFDRVSQDDCREGYLLDGFPRTVAQAESLLERLGETPGNGVNLTVVNLVVPDEVIVERASGRLLCRGCDAIYHRTFSPPEGEACDACGGELYQRDDDRAEVVVERLKAYHEQTEPVVAWFQSWSGEPAVTVCEVDGNRKPEEVFEACVDCVKEVA